jgi:hypothetical protein
MYWELEGYQSPGLILRPWYLDNLLAPPQTQRLVPACTGEAISRQYLFCELCELNRYATDKYFRNGEVPASLSFRSEIYNSQA